MKHTKLLTALALAGAPWAVFARAQYGYPPPLPPPGQERQYLYQRPQPPTMIPNPSPGLIYGNPYGGPRVPEMVPNYGAPGMPAVGGGLTPSVPQGGGRLRHSRYGN